MVFGYFDEVRGGLVHFASETYCSMESRRAKNAMKEMAAGTYIVLAGEGSGHTFRDPSIRNCRLLSDNDPLYVPEPGTATEPAPPPVVEAESEPARESEREQTAGSPELQQSSAEPEPAAEPEPPEAPGLSEASTVTLDLFRELYEFRNDPEFHRIGFSVTGRFNAWMVRLDETAERYHDQNGTVLSEIGYIPGELRTLATDYMDHGGCPSGNYARDMETQLIAEAEVPRTACTGKSDPEPSDPAQDPVVRHSSGLLEQKHHICTVVMGRSRADLDAVVTFCNLFGPGYYEGAGADGVLLNLWLTETLARGFLDDRLQARKIANDLISSWSTLSGDPFPAIRFYWGDVLIMSARGRARGVEVKFEL